MRVLIGLGLLLLAAPARAQTVGSPCDPSVFTERCSVVGYTTCEEMKVVEVECVDDEQCCVTGANQVGCVDTEDGECPSPDFDEGSCAASAGGGSGALGPLAVLAVLGLVRRRRRRS